MCGIAGWVKSGSSACARALVKTMADTIAHRGPDDEGFYFAPGIAMGHRRLSIIDLKTGHQPMMTQDSRYVIVYNGEVYNFTALRNELEALGEVFVTHSDTEVLLKAFRRWGPDVFARFKGMFAMAIWDSAERILHIARDHIGIKPLYYAEFGNEFIFASEVKALLCHPKMERRMEPDVAASFLAFNNSFGDKSFWTGVKRCQPGERIEWRNGALKRFRFFDIGNLKVEPFKGTFEDASVRYRELLSDSVKDHLISDVPIGSYLSGGIDSSSVSSLAARFHSLPFPVFTGFFKGHEGGWYDERSGADIISKKGGMIHYECPITWNDFHERLAKVCYHLDEPTLGSGAIPQFIVAESVRKHVKVVLTGHGGDELFGGYPVFKAVFLRSRGIGMESLKCLFSGSLDEFIRAAYFAAGGAVDHIRARGQLRMFSPSGIDAIGGEALNDAVARAGGIDSILSGLQPFASAQDVDGVTRWYVATYLTTLLTQEDKISMAHGLEARVPICYEALLKFSISLPEDIKLAGGELKAVPREGMKPILPDDIYRLPKRGFPTPVVKWLSKGGLSGEWESAWRGPLPGPISGLLNPAGVIKEFSRFRKVISKMPNAYAAAHRLVSLQMLYSCAKALAGVPIVKDIEGVKDQEDKMPGSLVLKGA